MGPTLKFWAAPLPAIPRLNSSPGGVHHFKATLVSWAKEVFPELRFLSFFITSQRHVPLVPPPPQLLRFWFQQNCSIRRTGISQQKLGLFTSSPASLKSQCQAGTPKKGASAVQPTSCFKMAWICYLLITPLIILHFASLSQSCNSRGILCSFWSL